MINCNNQLKTEFLETKKVSLFLKFTAIFLALIFALIPLAELIHEFDYNYNNSETSFNGYLVGYDIRSLQFKETPISN